LQCFWKAIYLIMIIFLCFTW